MTEMDSIEEREWLAQQFEGYRTHLRSVAFRMLGSLTDADDAVQEAWLRLSRSGTDGVENLGGWLTTVVARVCLDMLRSRSSRREEPLESVNTHLSDPLAGGIDPEHEVVMADSVGLALLVVLESLTPAERLAFVLHDMFAIPFNEIAPIVGRSPAAARQLASRARRRVQLQGEGTILPGAVPGASPDTDLTRRRKVVDAFLSASRHGDFAALLSLLDPNVVLHADHAAVAVGADKEVRGATAVAGTFSGRARVAQPALVNGEPGAVWSHRGRPRIVFAFTIAKGKIARIELIADPERLGQLDLSILDA